MNVGNIEVGVNIEYKDYKKGLTNMENATKTALNQIGSLFKAIIGSIIVREIARIGKAMVEAAATVQAQEAQFKATFKGIEESATKMFDKVSEKSGVFAERLQVEGTKAYSQFKGAGLDANEALSETERFLNLATDAAAYYDISLEDASAKVRSFMRGNTEAGDSIGLFTSEASRNQAAIDEYGVSWIKLTEAQKQMLMLNMTEEIYKQSGAIGQASREANGYENVVGNLKEAWKQFMAAVGAPILSAIVPILQGLATAIITIGNGIKVVNAFLAEHQILAYAITGAIMGIVGALIYLSPIIPIITDALAALGAAFVAVNWQVILISAAVTAVIAIGIYLIKHWDEVKAKAQEIWGNIEAKISEVIENIKTKISDMVAKVTEFWNNLGFNIGYAIGSIIGHVVNLAIKIWNFATVDVPNFVDKVVEWFKALPSKIWHWLLNTAAKIPQWISDMGSKVSSGMPNLISSILGFFASLPRQFLSIGSNIVTSLWNGISGGWNWLTSQVSSLAKGLLAGVKKTLKIGSPSKLFRDEVGTNIAKGIWVGFDKEYSDIAKRMETAVANEAFNVGANVTSTQGENNINVSIAGGTLESNSNITVALDGRAIASAVNAENKKIQLQYGVSNAY